MFDWKKLKDDVGKGIKGGAQSVSKKAGEITAEGQRKVKVFNLKRKIDEQMSELGKAIYQAEKATKGTITDEAAKAVFKKITKDQAELKALEKKIKKS